MSQHDVQPRGSHWIGGALLAGEGGAALPVLYPATGEVIATLAEATPAVIDAAVASAREGFTVWSRTPPAERGRVLRRAADIIRARGAELARLETLDTGKPIQETEVADWPSGADALEYFGALAATMTGEMIDLGGDFVYTRREPLGICAGIGAWNYPSQIACWKAAPALACGNAMIFKPSEVTPLGALKLGEILREAGLPDGVFNVVQGTGPVGAALVSHPMISKVSVTGSVGTGKRVYAGAAASLKHVTLELGGKSPLIVFDDADIDSAIGGAMLGNFYSSGQICSNGTRVFVQDGVRARFLTRLAERAEAIRMGDPLDPATQMGPLVSAAQGERVMDYIAKGQAEGAWLLTGGARAAMQGFDGGFFVQPTVFAEVTDDMTIAREEIFGPVMSVLGFAEEEEVIARANATDFGLAAGVFTADLARAHRVVGQLRAGATWINTYNLTPVEAPFGGVKGSGIGRENGHAALEHYSQVKSVYVGTGPVEAPY
ncbi:betaine-aldehyde dehydrogenase [Amaricoccus solimangrovi]|uniref:Betaine aldehyde dehydrogenase n=1 Tax=Amaricoccus solimangrovi TaxID=2589815 RepID=A0A501WNL8_9RHOB|nr:betaine-aldehyde dehydrogenase [Amaricoccus solimangrovi]TPE50442.1 betaine-aldehyde dehydrogenase [Amaricoccus solimangrovi]